MTLLDRYIFKSVLATCAAAVGLFVFIVVIPNFARDLLPHMLAGHIPAITFFKLLILLVPLAVTFALPMGMLTGVLLTLGRLSADSEITAMRAAGLSVSRVTRPVVLLALLGVGVGLYFNFESMPRARVEYHKVFAEVISSNPLSLVIPKTFIRDFQGMVVYVGEKEGGMMRDIWLWELDKDRRVKRIVRAAAGHFEYEESTNSLILTLIQAQAEMRSEKHPENFDDPPMVVSVEKSEPYRLSLDRFFGRASGPHIKQEWMTFQELNTERARIAALPLPTDPVLARAATLDKMKLEIVYQDKFNTALAVLSLALVGIPLGIKVSRRETSANFAVAVGLTLAYYLMTVAVKVLDRHPEYRPDLLLWAPNILLLGFGLWLMTRIEKR